MGNDSVTVVHGNQAVPRITKRAFLITGTAKKGRAVCYNHDITDAVAEETSGSSTISTPINVWCDARRVQVEYPTYHNHLHFAGVIDEASDGKEGPCWITIHEPGSICEIYSGSIASSQITGGVAGSKILTFCMPYNTTVAIATAMASAGIAQGTFIGGGLRGSGSAWVLAEGVASAYYMAELMTGPQSGGVEVIRCGGPLLGQATTTAPIVIRHGAVIAYATAATVISVLAPPFQNAELIFSLADVSVLAGITTSSLQIDSNALFANAAVTAIAIKCSSHTAITTFTTPIHLLGEPAAGYWRVIAAGSAVIT